MKQVFLFWRGGGLAVAWKTLLGVKWSFVFSNEFHCFVARDDFAKPLSIVGPLNRCKDGPDFFSASIALVAYKW